MNGYDGIPGTTNLMVYRRLQIKRADERIVFLDEGRLSPNSWTLWYDQERWWDQITARHGDGTNFGFADGHSEYWKWKDPRTVDVAKADYTVWQNTTRNGADSYLLWQRGSAPRPARRLDQAGLHARRPAVDGCRGNRPWLPSERRAGTASACLHHASLAARLGLEVVEECLAELRPEEFPSLGRRVGIQSRDPVRVELQHAGVDAEAVEQTLRRSSRGCWRSPETSAPCTTCTCAAPFPDGPCS